MPFDSDIERDGAAIEYDQPSEQEIEYRGHAGALWKRGAEQGYDDCTAQLFERAEGK